MARTSSYEVVGYNPVWCWLFLYFSKFKKWTRLNDHRMRKNWLLNKSITVTNCTSTVAHKDLANSNNVWIFRGDWLSYVKTMINCWTSWQAPWRRGRWPTWTVRRPDRRCKACSRNSGRPNPDPWPYCVHENWKTTKCIIYWDGLLGSKANSLLDLNRFVRTLKEISVRQEREKYNF